MKYLPLFALAILTACSHPPARHLASLEEDLQRLDINKKTVCTVTLNSDEEKNTFRKSLKGFNFLELAGDKASSNWLESACEKKVQCDVLLVSGHFAGKFFGKSGLSLPLARLENLSCSSTCPGIFEHPKEVFLMGCNTLAGKTKDHRTPEEYVQVLVGDGFTRQQAEQVAAARYSVIGSSNLQRMRWAFPGSETKLYGFDSIGPSGKSVEALLQKYLSSVPNYDQYLSAWKPREQNTRLAEALKITSFTQALPLKEKPNNPACVLGSNRPITQKLAWINQVLGDNAYALAYMPNITEYFRRLDQSFGDHWPDTEQSYLEYIQQNRIAKAHLLKLLEKPLPGILSQQAEILNFARSVGWVDQRGYISIAKGLIGDTFKHNLTLEQKDSICSSGMELALGKAELPTERWNEFTLQAIACIKAKGEGVEEALINDLQKPDVPQKLRANALVALGGLGPLSPATQQKLIGHISDQESDSGYAAAIGLANSGPTTEAAHLKLISLLHSDDGILFGTATDGLKNSHGLSAKAQMALIEFLKQEEVPYEVYGCMGPEQITAPEVRKKIWQMFRDPSESVRDKAMTLFREGGWPRTPEAQRLFAEALGDSSESIRGSANLYFTQDSRDPLSEEVQAIALKWLRKGDAAVRADLMTFFSSKEDRPIVEVQREMVKAMQDHDTGVRTYAAYALGTFCGAIPDARSVLEKAQKDPDEMVRNAVKTSLARCESH